jgi:hypothetical protein
VRWLSAMAGAFVVVAASGVGCRRARDEQLPAIAELSLPDALAGFVASPVVAGTGYVRRTYTRGRTRIDVTLARAALPPGGFDSWVTMSRPFPQAVLDAPAADANGFYQCTEVPTPSCDLLVQLRSGVHLEIRGGGTSARDDVDALAHGLPLRVLAAAPSGATGF